MDGWMKKKVDAIPPTRHTPHLSPATRFPFPSGASPVLSRQSQILFVNLFLVLACAQDVADSAKFSKKVRTSTQHVQKKVHQHHAAAIKFTYLSKETQK